MASERAGERVFTNIDQALADRIISRSMENSREAEPVFGAAAESDFPRAGAAGAECGHRVDDAGPQGESFGKVIKIAAAAIAVLVLAVLIFRRRRK